MNTLYNDIAEAMRDATWDDVAAGLACATLCAASASIFVVMFTGIA